MYASVQTMMMQHLEQPKEQRLADTLTNPTEFITIPA
jgi:hypothetical protein